jgi:hypothetical protein
MYAGVNAALSTTVLVVLSAVAEVGARPRFVRAVAALARSLKLLAFWAAPVMRLSSPAAAVPEVVPVVTPTV